MNCSDLDLDQGHAGKRFDAGLETVGQTGVVRFRPERRGTIADAEEALLLSSPRTAELDRAVACRQVIYKIDTAIRWRERDATRTGEFGAPGGVALLRQRGSGCLLHWRTPPAGVTCQ